ncbi:sensor histidine kinase [soil metagenome]
MTTDTATATSRPGSALSRVEASRGYGGLWAGVPRELGFLLPTLPIVIAGLSAISAVFFTGLGLVFILVGLFIVLASLFIARGFGVVELARLRWAGFPRIQAPAWDRRARGSSWFAKIMAPVIDGHYWLYLLHTLIVNPIVGIVSWTLTIVWLSVGLGGTFYWFYSQYIPSGDRDWYLFGPGVNEGIVYVVAGLIFLATLPFVTRGLTWVHYGIAKGMLSAWLSEQLQVQVTGLASSRTAAVAAEGTALRRLERDIHDGPQQRLVRLQMDLAAADRKLDSDPEAARALLEEAMQQSKDALEELRALSRGFAPPILLDRGLVAALESLAVRAALPTTVTSTSLDGSDLPPELERNAYFIAAEALTNAAKHSGAAAAHVHVELRRVPDGDQTWLDVTISDDGQGGAAAVPGHGLAGLEERVHGLGGILELTSPTGGPTVVAAHLPVTH